MLIPNRNEDYHVEVLTFAGRQGVWIFKNKQYVNGYQLQTVPNEFHPLKIVKERRKPRHNFDITCTHCIFSTKYFQKQHSRHFAEI